MPIHFATDAAPIDRLWRRAIDGLRRKVVEIAGTAISLAADATVRLST